MERSRIVCLIGQLKYEVDKGILVFSYQFEGKEMSDQMSFTKDGEVVSCDLNNMFTVMEFLTMKKIDHCQLTDEVLESSLKSDLVHFVKNLLAVHNQLLDAGHEMNNIWQNEAAVVVTDELATITMYFGVESFAVDHPEAFKYMPDKDKVVGFVVSTLHNFSFTVDKNGEVVSITQFGN